jgi:hypothetical protein
VFSASSIVESAMPDEAADGALHPDWRGALQETPGCGGSYRILPPIGVDGHGVRQYVARTFDDSL